MNLNDDRFEKNVKRGFGVMAGFIIFWYLLIFAAVCLGVVWLAKAVF